MITIAQFQHFGFSHITALIATVLGAICMVKFIRSDAPESLKTKVRYGFGSILILVVLMDPVLCFMRWGTGDEGWKMFWNSSLPLYLCDVTSIVTAIALFSKNHRYAEIAYLWGLAGTTQGLITPTLFHDWDTMEYYNFFLQHSGVPIAAITLVWGMRIVPRKGAFKRIVVWSWAYMLVTKSINHIIDENYGFLNRKPEFDTLFNYMGDYPYYLITLQVMAFAVYYVLLRLAPKRRG